MGEPEARATAGAQTGVPPAQLEAWTRVLLERSGASDEAADATAWALVDANRRGLDSHGVLFLSFYLPRLRAGTTRGDSHPRVVVDLPSLAVIDGRDALGPYVASFAMRHCCANAKKSGAAVALVRNSSHFGAASCYAQLAAEQGCVGIVVSNSDPGMTPLGGLGPLLGTNPLAIAAPPVPGEAMPMLDIATSVVAQAKIMLAERAGAPIPEEWAIGPDGRPTSDPTSALAGAALPMAGHKGFALAFMIDVLTGCITGGRTSPDIVGDPEARTPQGIGHCFIAIHVASACASDAYEESLRRLVHRVHSAPRAEWADPFLMPGEPEARTSSERSESIPLPTPTVDLLRALGAEAGVPFPV